MYKAESFKTSFKDKCLGTITSIVYYSSFGKKKYVKLYYWRRLSSRTKTH